MLKQELKNKIENLYSEYLNGAGMDDQRLEKEVSRVSAQLDTMIESQTVTDEIICDYEEAAKHAAFYAGYMAALKSI